MRACLAAVMIWLGCALAPLAQEATGLAVAQPDGSQIRNAGLRDVEIALSLSEAVPWRVFTLDQPPRLVMDFQEVDWRVLRRTDFHRSDRVRFVEYGGYVPGWSRMVAELAAPMAIEQAGMLSGQDGASLILRLTPQDPAAFAAQAGAPNDPRWDLPEPALLPRGPARGPDAPLRVVLDPGHGGIDPGAQAPGLNEKSVTLVFARELRRELMEAGGFEVVLTRDDDRFVSLDRRVAMAHQAGADVFISLHADALSQGIAHGASVHLLSEEASDAASEQLAQRHDRADLLAGVDLTLADDEITQVLLDMARRETEPRTEALGAALIAAFEGAEKQMITRPLRRANYSVLKSADIPSVLIELGFMSSPKDLERLVDLDWRAGMARAIRVGLEDWRRADAALRPLVRQ
ncbi:MAG: N-acetylmuramoyl-L-alanine amidase [Rhodobacteraceae bacterium]|nr:N-acetylmuramoyl-L-alanine amidase [Paracoccaceae bacterium]